MDSSNRIRTLSPLLLLAAITGCAGEPIRSESTGLLPFTVKLNEARIPRVNRAGRGEAQPDTPVLFRHPSALTRGVARVLEESGVFTRVLTPEERGVAADLELDLSIEGDDFGPGTPSPGGATFSTVVWLTAGYFSWLIKDREYPDSNVILSVTIRPGAGPEGARSPDRPRDNLFEDDLLLKGMQLSLAERATGWDWVLGFILPPWLPEGDPESAGETLAHQRTVEFFADTAPPRIISRLPSLHFEDLGCFLIHAPETSEVIIVARQRVDLVEISPEGREPAPPLEEELDRLVVTDEDELADLRLYLSGREGGVVRPGARDSVYRIPLERGQRGFVRIAAFLGEKTARWTVYQEPAADGGTVRVASGR